MIKLSPLREASLDSCLRKIDKFYNGTRMFKISLDPMSVTIPYNTLVNFLWELIEEQEKLVKQEILI